MKTSKPGTETDTKERILEAAEQLFADAGFGNTSLRAITAAAGVNLAAVNYHFGSKEALIEQVFARRLGPMNQARLVALEEAQAAGTPTIRAIVEAFVDPALSTMHEPGGAVFLRLYGQALGQCDPHTLQILASQFRGIVDRFSEAFHEAMPQLPTEEIRCRFLFMGGALAHTLAFSDRMPGWDEMPQIGLDALGRRLVEFIVAGVQSPVPEGSER